MLTTKEFAERYSIEGVNNEKSWRRILDDWRSKGSLKEGEYTYRFSHGRPAVQYQEYAVLRLVWLSDRAFAVAVRLLYKGSIREKLTKEKQPISI